ncbi:MAG: aminotransferase class III-fold pyridoxal phosphate-dependent enzyme [Chitinophagaceae bacterium]|jgi:acetylornithine aminotransferase|nr:aminotransferase class III-fold pyridoxal phosphate-dependent enzyme [Chitinophagaceae bacterium]
MKLFDVYPVNDIVIERAMGSYVWDANGVQYLDMYGGHAVISIGHSHPHWVNRIQHQLSRISFYSNSVKIPLQEELAAKLGHLSGKTDYQLFLCNSGAEANENAMKLASFHTGRKKIIAFYKSFHGRTSLAVAATDNAKIVAPVNETENIVFLPLNNEEKLEACFKQMGNDIAAVIVEGIQGVGGIHEATAGFLQTISKLCRQYGAVYIADSVQCGYGRSGQFFAHDIAGVDADIYTTAKGMGNGFPIGGVLIAPHIKPRHGMLGTTFGGNHLACAAAIAVLEVMEKENLLEKVKQRGMYLRNRLAKVEGVTAIRGRGLMVGFEVDAALKDLRKNLLYDFNIFTGEAKPDVIRLLPALTIQRKQLDEFLDAVQEAVAALQKPSI